MKKSVYRDMYEKENCICIHVYSGITSRCVSLTQAYELAKRYRIPNMIVIWQLEKWCNIKYEDVFAKEQFPDVNLGVLNYQFFPPDWGEGVKAYLKKGQIGKLFSCLGQWALYFARACYNRKAERLMDYFRRNNTYVRYDPDENTGWEGKAYEEWGLTCWSRVKGYLENRVNFCAGIYCGMMRGEDLENQGDASSILFDRKYTELADSVVSDGGQGWVGVHVRRTDHNDSIKESTLDCFTEKMKEAIADDQEVRFFLATDDREVERELCETFPERVFTCRNKVWGRNSRSGMESAIVDFLCLSKCRYILGSFNSVFSSFAAEYGNKELVVCRK